MVDGNIDGNIGGVVGFGTSLDIGVNGTELMSGSRALSGSFPTCEEMASPLGLIGWSGHGGEFVSGGSFEDAQRLSGW
jgi:hypothetical protein